MMQTSKCENITTRSCIKIMSTSVRIFLRTAINIHPKESSQKDAAFFPKLRELNNSFLIQEKVYFQSMH